MIGGTVKTSDISSCNLRQRGIQEINGQDTVKPIAKFSERITEVKNGNYWLDIKKICSTDRKGVAFIEFPIDLQSKEFDLEVIKNPNKTIEGFNNFSNELDQLNRLMKSSNRISFLIGGGCSKETALDLNNFSKDCNIPIFTTYNGAYRIDSSDKNYFGLPNTWGQRYSNILIQHMISALMLII